MTIKLTFKYTQNHLKPGQFHSKRKIKMLHQKVLILAGQIRIGLMKRILTSLFFICASMTYSFAQTDSLASGNVDIYLIDSYVTPETPHKLVVSFFTSNSTTSRIFILGKKEFEVSKSFSDNHKIEIDLSAFENIVSPLRYKIFVMDKKAEESQSQIYEVEMPQNLVLKTERDLGMLQVCCFGGVIFGLPSPTIVNTKGKQYFSLAKEIPLFSFYSTGYNYPFGYFGIEYAYIFNAAKKNFMRVGYKQIIQTGFIKYISPGINYFTDFLGYNGISPEITFGLFQLQNVFTFYARYRYNFQPDKSGTDFHEMSIGLYSNFFSINF